MNTVEVIKNDYYHLKKKENRTMFLQETDFTNQPLIILNAGSAFTFHSSLRYVCQLALTFCHKEVLCAMRNTIFVRMDLAFLFNFRYKKTKLPQILQVWIQWLMHNYTYKLFLSNKWYFYLFVCLFLYLFLAALGLRCCDGLSLVAARGLVTAVASLVAGQGSRCTGFRSCGMWAQ